MVIHQLFNGMSLFYCNRLIFLRALLLADCHLVLQCQSLFEYMESELAAMSTFIFSSSLCYLIAYNLLEYRFRVYLHAGKN